MPSSVTRGALCTARAAKRHRLLSIPPIHPTDQRQTASAAAAGQAADPRTMPKTVFAGYFSQDRQALKELGHAARRIEGRSQPPAARGRMQGLPWPTCRPRRCGTGPRTLRETESSWSRSLARSNKVRHDPQRPKTLGLVPQPGIRKSMGHRIRRGKSTLTGARGSKLTVKVRTRHEIMVR